MENLLSDLKKNIRARGCLHSFGALRDGIPEHMELLAGLIAARGVCSPTVASTPRRSPRPREGEDEQQIWRISCLHSLVERICVVRPRASISLLFHE
jgi:hypothetical protein